MEYKDPMIELLSSLEQIVFKDKQTLSLRQRPNAFSEFEQLRKNTGLKIDDFAQAMGVSVTTAQEWESRRIKPSRTELKLLRFIHKNHVSKNKLIT